MPPSTRNTNPRLGLRLGNGMVSRQSSTPDTQAQTGSFPRQCDRNISLMADLAPIIARHVYWWKKFTRSSHESETKKGDPHRGPPLLFYCGCLGRRPRRWLAQTYSTIFETTPAPTVRPPSRMAKRSFSSIAIGTISSTFTSTLSPGITISVPSFSVTTPVTSVVRK